MTAGAQWVLLVSLASGFEADEARSVLEAEEIPVLVKGLQTGIFGGGFQGSVPGGVDLFVPSPELAHARQLLDLE